MPTITIIDHTTYMKHRKSPIQYIILHYSASTHSGKGAARGTVTTLDQRGYSSDYAVDDDTILQFAKDPEKWRSTAVQNWSSKGTAAGRYATNDNSVSIEMSSTLDKGGKWVPNDPHFRFTQEVLDNTAFLCRILISKYNIPQQNIIRHHDIMGKDCPGIIGWNHGQGSPNEDEYHKFVASLYGGSYTAPEINYEVAEYEYTSPVGTSGKNSSSSADVSYSGVNHIQKLASATRENENILKQKDTRKNDFEALRNKMTSDAPDMGRNIIHTAELYDSNILKGNQESKIDRLPQQEIKTDQT